MLTVWTWEYLHPQLHVLLLEFGGQKCLVAPLGISSEISCQKFQGFELTWHLQKCWLGSMSLRGRELHSSLYLGIELKFLTALGVGGKVLLEGELPSVEGGQGLPAPDGSAAGPSQDTAEPFNQTGGTSVKTYLRPENTDGGSIRGGNEGAEKGGMNKNNDKQQREHHS